MQILYISNFSSFFIFILASSFILFVITRMVLGRETKIKGDFWEHKKLAKGKIAWLNFLFIVTLLLIFLTAYASFMFILSFVYFDTLPLENSVKISLGISLVIILVIILAYFFKSIQMSKHSIDALAKTLKASEILESKADFEEKILLNVVEEMAIASNVNMPRVFVMREELGVNAMCSGENFGRYNEKIAIFVTAGALKTFSRDELQGVIGHEFSHAFHCDVELNLKLFSIVFAFTCIMLLSEIFLRMTKGTPKSKDSGKAMFVIMFFSLVCFLAGLLGSLFAQIIQSAISRQKEFLADASSVQYTRNPNGIKDALIKILNLEQNKTIVTKVNNPNAHPCAHMFFFSAFNNIFATHPPLDKRINRLEQISGIKTSQ